MNNEEPHVDYQYSAKVRHRRHGSPLCTHYRNRWLQIGTVWREPPCWNLGRIFISKYDFTKDTCSDSVCICVTLSERKVSSERVISRVHMQKIHPGANLHPRVYLHPGANLHPLVLRSHATKLYPCDLLFWALSVMPCSVANFMACHYDPRIRQFSLLLHWAVFYPSHCPPQYPH